MSNDLSERCLLVGPPSVQALLTHVLTPIQAARYLLAGHPFTWNGLAFAHSLAGLAPSLSAAAR